MLHKQKLIIMKFLKTLRSRRGNAENQHKYQKHLGIKQVSFIVILLLLQCNVFAQRGRPHISNELGFNQLLTDNNTRLRGVSLSWDGGDNETHDAPAVMPTQEELNSLSAVYGLNCIHVYLEMNCPIEEHADIHVVGKNAEICDSLVDMAEEANLYVIITIGCGNWNGQISSLEWAQDFWNFYAPRYADRTHVIYETHNEPGDHTPSDWTTSDWDNQVTLFNTIRTNAPNTHIMTCSFMSFSTPSSALDGIKYMKDNGVDFSNASVAFHGYETMGSIENCMVEFMYDTEFGMTPALICTEYNPGDNDKGFCNMLELRNVGWTQFLYLGADIREVRGFKRTMDKYFVTWEPDYGDWPVVVPLEGVAISPTNLELPVLALRPLTPILTPTIATNQTVLYSSSNDAIATVSPIGIVAGVSEGSAIITATTHEGNYTATCAVTVTAALPRPYLGVPASIPGTIEIENFDNGGEGIAYHDEGSHNIGGQYRIYEGVDIDICGEGGYNVGWIAYGEWLEFTVDVAATDAYDIDLRVASDYPSLIRIEFNGIDKTGLISTPSTAGWQTYETVTVGGVLLSEGEQVMRICMEGSAFNFNNITFRGGSTVVPVTGVSLNPTSATIEVGATQQLVAAVSPENATNQAVSYVSSNTSVATVNSTGLVTGVDEGSAIITVTTQEGGYTATSDVTVIYGSSGPPVSAHVQSIATGTQVAGRGASYGSATVTIHSNLETVVSGATVTGTFSGSFSETVTGVTGADGTVTLVTTGSERGMLSVDLCVDDVSHSSLTYDAAANDITCTGALKNAGELGIENTEPLSFSIYPNPANQTINVVSSINENFSVNLYNMNGVLQLQKSIQNQNSSIDISELPNGVYLMQITSSKQTEMVKFIKGN